MISCAGTTEVGSLQFTLDQIAGFSEFVAMYDQYKLMKVVLNIQLVNNPDSLQYPGAPTLLGNGQPTCWYPKFWYIRDYDGGGSDTMTQIKERQGAKFFVLQPNRTKSIVIRPMATVQTYRTATSTGYSPKRLWIDIANGTDVPHYGLNYIVDALGQDPENAYPFVIRVERKFYFACKGVR